MKTKDPKEIIVHTGSGVPLGFPPITRVQDKETGLERLIIGDDGREIIGLRRFLGDPVGTAVYTEEWYGEDQKRKLRELVETVKYLPGAYMEVGTWEGRSTEVYANAVWEANESDVLVVVDHFRGVVGDGKELTDKALQERDIFKVFLRNMMASTHCNIVVYKMSWQDCFTHHWGLSLKLVHIDGSHTYEEVKGNIEAVLPHLVPGGIICFDDYYFGPVHQAIQDTLPGSYYDALGIWVKPTH